MTISREIKTSILAILGIVLFVLGFNYLKGKNLLKPKNVFYTEFDYNALTSSSPVTVRGNVIGKINTISFDTETGKTKVAFTVNKAFKFPKNSTVKLYQTGLMGGNGLAILPKETKKDKNIEFAKPGDLLKSEIEYGLITNLSKKFSSLSSDLGVTLKSADSLLLNLNSMVKDDTDNGLKATISELNNTLKSYKKLSVSLNSVVLKNEANLTKLINNFNTLSQDLTLVVGDLKDLKLSNTVSSLDQTLTNVNTLLTDIQLGKGTAGKLINDEQLYLNMESASKELEELLRDIKLHPKRYFRILSKKEIPYKK